MPKGNWIGNQLRNPIRVEKTTWNGKERLDVRHYYESEDGELKPTRKGVSMPIEEAKALVKAINTALNES